MKRSILRRCLQTAISKNRPDIHPEWGNYTHFCFIVQDNKIVEWGMNRPANALAMCGFRPERHKIHAEVDAYRKARGLLEKRSGFEAINIRLNKSGDPRISAPCPCCTAFLNTAGCKRVYFTTNAGWAKTT